MQPTANITPSAVRSRQRQYQLRNKAAGKCVACAQPAEPGRTRCTVCREKNYEYQKFSRQKS